MLSSGQRDATSHRTWLAAGVPSVDRDDGKRHLADDEDTTLRRLVINLTGRSGAWSAGPPAIGLGDLAGVGVEPFEPTADCKEAGDRGTLPGHPVRETRIGAIDQLAEEQLADRVRGRQHRQVDRQDLGSGRPSTWS